MQKLVESPTEDIMVKLNTSRINSVRNLFRLLLIAFFSTPLLYGCSNSVKAKIYYSAGEIQEHYTIEGVFLVKEARLKFMVNGILIVDSKNIFENSSRYDVFVGMYNGIPISIGCRKNYEGVQQKYFSCRISIRGENIASAVFK